MINNMGSLLVAIEMKTEEESSEFIGTTENNMDVLCYAVEIRLKEESLKGASILRENDSGYESEKKLKQPKPEKERNSQGKQLNGIQKIKNDSGFESEKKLKQPKPENDHNSQGKQMNRIQRIKLAKKLVEQKILTLGQAAKKFSIPKSTLHDHVKNLRIGYRKGRPRVFLYSQEKLMAEEIRSLIADHEEVTLIQIRGLVYSIAEANNLKHDFDRVKKLAGRKWLSSFMRRHNIVVPKNKRPNTRLPKNARKPKSKPENAVSPKSLRRSHRDRKKRVKANL